MDHSTQIGTWKPKHSFWKLVVVLMKRPMAVKPGILLDETWLHAQFGGIEVSVTGFRDVHGGWQWRRLVGLSLRTDDERSPIQRPRYLLSIPLFLEQLN